MTLDELRVEILTNGAVDMDQVSAELDSVWGCKAPSLRIFTALAAALMLATSGCAADGPEAAEAPSSTSALSSSPSAPSAQTEATSAAAAFIKLADGGKDEVLWADTITYSIAGVSVAKFAPDKLPSALSGCPQGASEVEQRKCPVSALRAVASAKKAAVVEQSLPETVGCNIFKPPPVPESATPAVVRLAKNKRNCVDDFAVALFVDDAGHVNWVDLTLSSP